MVVVVAVIAVVIEMGRWGWLPLCRWLRIGVWVVVDAASGGRVGLGWH